ncbi:MAG: L,D-transpeptidase family protein [Alphaproteobacteria bacterium]|nr:L,D-transpeptidase family protein [Alphaproteobacteria bacterium]
MKGLLPRVGLLAGATIALAAGCAPSEPPVVARGKSKPLSLVASSPATAFSGTELSGLIETAPKSVVRGERLNVELLRRFYARHGFQPVWTSRQAQANSLLDALARAGEHGLSPELFHMDLLMSPATSLTSLDRELLLSSAFLSYADALAHGVVPLERRRDEEALAPRPVDVAAALDAALATPDPGATIEALAPTTPTYLALRHALQVSRTGGGKIVGSRSREIEVNLERERWLPRKLPADRVWVNAAEGRLVLYRNDQPVFTTRVIVGQDERRNQSPEFEALIEGIWFNPPWVVPEDIARDEILPKTRTDPNYLAKHNMVLRPDGVLEQKEGGNSGLGHFLFDMNNRFDVYLHDTPSRDLFTRDNRRISHGCIRVEKPDELVALLMRQQLETIKEAVATGDTYHKRLPTPVPVFVVYETAFADDDGKLQFRADIYRRDDEIRQYLTSKGQAVAERRPAAQR